MTSLGEETLHNTSFIDIICLYVNRLFGIFGLTSHLPFSQWDDVSVNLSVDKFDDLVAWLSFDDFQIYILKIFLGTLVICIILILISWKVYGEKICQRFMKPATTKVIEELRKSVSQLKLPKEHTPRI